MSTVTTAPITARSRSTPEQYKAISQQILVVAVLILLFVPFAIMKPTFTGWSNLLSLLLTFAVTGAQALGLSFVIVTGGIDLTPGFDMAVTSMFAGVLIARSGGSGLPMRARVLGGLAADALLGSINGVLMAYVKMQPMITALAMAMVCWGAVLVMADGKSISLCSVRGHSGIAVDEIIPGVCNSILTLILLTVVVGVLTNHAAVRRYSLSIGSNEEATHTSGVDTRRQKMPAYAICGLFAGISGILMSPRLSAAQPTLGQGCEMCAIAAAVIGDASLRGSRVLIFSAVISAVTIQTTFNGLIVMDAQDQWQKVVLEAAVLIAVVVGIVRRGGKEE